MYLLIYKLDSDIDAKPLCVLKEGEHIIGRGELLKCPDKRASRAHAVIKITPENAAITSMHQNPCFFQATSSKMVTILTKDVPTELNDGDKFGIFADQYWFRVKILEHISDECLEIEKASTSQKRTFNQNNLRQHKIIKIDESNSKCTYPDMKEVLSSSDDEYDIQTQEQKNVNSEVAIVDHIKKSVNMTEETVSGLDLTDILSSTDNNTFGIGELTSNDADLEYGSNNNTDSKLESNDIQSNTTNVNVVEVNSTLVVDQPSLSHTADVTDEAEVNNASSVDQPSLSHTADVTDEAEVNNASSVDQPSSSGNSGDPIDNQTIKVLRDRCWYGRQCYRKNADHKKNFSHPGDSDYESDAKDSRPVCSFGARCYRKNKDHRKEYRHPRRNRKRQAPTQTELDDEDDYDYNDPFLTDGSEDEYSEESWSDSDEGSFDNDENDEDTKALIKEAKRFTKQKK